MRKAVRHTLLFSLAAVTMAGVLFGIYRFSWRGEVAAAMGPISTDGRHVLLNGKQPANRTLAFHFNTFNQDTLTQDRIRDCFNWSVNTLSRRLNAAPVYVLRTDEEGWDQLCAVWKLPDGYAEAGAGSGNDNDYVYVAVGPGEAPPGFSNKPGNHDMLKNIFAR
jgi:hypothetical protein